MAYSWWVVCWREGWKRIQSHAMLLLVCVPCQQTKAWCEGWFFRNHVFFKCFFWSPNWRSCNLWKGHLKPTKRVTWKNSAPKTPTRNLKMPTWKTEKPTNIESIQHEISFGETPKPFIFFFGGGLKFDGNYIYNMWYIRKYMYIRGEHQLLAPVEISTAPTKKNLKGGGEKRGRILTLIKSIGWGHAPAERRTDARWKCFLRKKTQFGPCKKRTGVESWNKLKERCESEFQPFAKQLGCMCVFSVYCKLLQEYVDGVVMFPEKNSVL